MWRPMIVDFSLFLNRLFTLDRCDLVSAVHLKYKFNTMWKRSQISEIRIARNLGWQKTVRIDITFSTLISIVLPLFTCSLMCWDVGLSDLDSISPLLMRSIRLLLIVLWLAKQKLGRFMTTIRNSRVQMPTKRMNCFVLHKLISGLLQWYSCKSFHNTSKYMNVSEKNVRALIFEANCKFILIRKKYLIGRKKKLCL